jgi:hypothetical protein
LPSSSVTTANIADNAVTYAKIGTTEQGQLCKAWVNFNGTSTVSIRASYNVSSITDNGTGNYTINFTSALADANYAVAFSVGGGGAGLNAGFVAGVLTSTQYGVASNKTASAVQFTTGDYTATLRDLGEIYVSIFR